MSRLFERDICLFSASCMMNSIQFDITITAENNTEVLLIPSEIYKSISSNDLLSILLCIHSARGGFFYKCFVIFYGIVKTETTCKMISVKAVTY